MKEKEVAYSLLYPWTYGSVSVTSEQTPRVISVVSSVLQRLVGRNDENSMLIGNHGVTVFHGLRAPSISVDKYLDRIFKYANCSPSCFVVAYAYIDRFLTNHQNGCISSLNVHRLLITSILVAAKFMDDVYYNNAYYAKVGGISTEEMNRLELEFLFRVGFRLNVTVAAFESYCLHLQKEVALWEVERPIIPSYVLENEQKSAKQHPQQYLAYQQQMQRMVLWRSYAGV